MGRALAITRTWHSQKHARNAQIGILDVDLASIVLAAYDGKDIAGICDSVVTSMQTIRDEYRTLSEKPPMAPVSDLEC